MSKPKYNTVDDVIAKLKQVHGDKYDYSKATLGNRITLVCPKHGEWTAARSDIFRGSGCKKCYHENKMGITTEEFIARAKAIHGDRYDYSKVNFVDWKTNVDIVCPEHNVTTSVSPSNFAITGHVPKCCKSYKLPYPKEQFITTAKEIHGDKYDYRNVEYTSSQVKVEIICPMHGSFFQTPSNHVQNHGCPKCASAFSNSKAECNISDEFAIFERNNRTVIKPKELDLVSHEHKLAIEVNGAYWHSTKFLSPNYHLDKTNAVEAKGYQLLHFWDYEVSESPELVNSMIAAKLGSNKRIYARKCNIVVVTSEQARIFESTNHIQGVASGESIRYGLMHDNKLVSLMTFGKSRFDKKYDWELIRYCCLIGHNVIGGASKLFKHFLTHHDGSVMSYANRRISNGRLYNTLGFVEVSRTPPNYFWLSLSSGERLTRQKCQKHKLSKILGDRFNSEETEKQNMLRNGFVQCFDCGNIKYEYTI